VLPVAPVDRVAGYFLQYYSKLYIRFVVYDLSDKLITKMRETLFTTAFLLQSMLDGRYPDTEKIRKIYRQ